MDLCRENNLLKTKQDCIRVFDGVVHSEIILFYPKSKVNSGQKAKRLNYNFDRNPKIQNLKFDLDPILKKLYENSAAKIEGDGICARILYESNNTGNLHKNYLKIVLKFILFIKFKKIFKK